MRKITCLIIIIFLGAALALLVSFYGSGSIEEEEGQGEGEDYEVVVEDLEIPWEIRFLPTGEMLVTERPGDLLIIDEDKEVITVQGVEHTGEGGLMGLELHPDFEENNLIYLYFTSDIDGEIVNRVERYQLDLENNSLENQETILSGIPGASYHDGGRIEFGPDENLYITTGDAGDSDNSQSLETLAGKILRVDSGGNVPEDNPFGDEIYSYGHRNPQGITWDGEGNLWSTEHGRSGIKSGFDEINLIEKGNNYGWPVIQGDETEGDMVPPVIHSGSSTTWAPAGAVYYEGYIFFTGLRGESLYRYDIDQDSLEKFFSGEFGRLRAIVLHNESFYISTSNRDGRGTVNIDDDKIIKINPDNMT